ncbi:HAD-IIA family hydrolase [Alicyclobacillus sp. SO9]|uniref:HAD-IIA family hydrolase n=1 Tax=Alicyclobacillus sp. SO9 TaxID=2665646 RepID=UPI0018E8619C|nr:HAD-IIA family hydrolase [Alicyclobacillus sp. SO9]QQE77130.1 HAD-IIA family hydrolase [Alicyclobacillus sp. SO9]
MSDEVLYKAALAKHGWKAALIDLDGTLYRGDMVIEGAGEFIQRLRELDVLPVFFTNNSMRTPLQVADKLNGMGIDAQPEEVCTSSQMAAFTVRQQVGKGAAVAAIGDAGLKVALQEEGLYPVMADDDEQSVTSGNARVPSEASKLEPAGAVVGLNLRVTYQQLAWVCGHAARLSRWTLTNGDVRLPSTDGFLPGNGAIAAFVKAATGIEPQTVGKPNPAYVEFVLQRYHLKASEAVVIGDNVLTDVACGNAAGVDTIWVQSGVSYQRNEVADSSTGQQALEPLYTARSVAALFQK